MSKLDEAFLKAYAKDRGAAARIQPTVILRELSEETADKIGTDSDDRSVVRRDEGVVDVASFLGQSAGGRARGSAATEKAPLTQFDTKQAPPKQAPPKQASSSRSETFTPLAPPVFRPTASPAPAPSQAPSQASSLADAAPSVLVFDAAHTFRGPHYQPISLNLSALDLFASPPLTEDDLATAEAERESAANSHGDIRLSEPTARLAADVAEPTPVPSPAAEPTPAAPFQAVWEVDRFDFEETLCKLSAPDSPLREAGRRLQGACSEGLKVLAVTSPLREQGRSTLAVVLARMVAAAGARVVLLDGDLVRPSLADKLRLEVQLGWDEALRTGLPVEEVAVHSLADGFTVVPLVAPQMADPPRPSAAATAALLDRLREAFDLVIIDTGNIGCDGGWIPGAEQSGMIDAALVVEDARGDDPNAQQACLQRLRRLGIENIGIVENFAD